MHIPNALIIIIFLAQHISGLLISNLLITALIANLITGIVYLLKKHLPTLPLWLGFLISGSTLLSLYFAPHATHTQFTLCQALMLGCAQSFALLPGISRMAMTVSTAIWLGIEPTTSFVASLICELLLIIVAVTKALLSTNSHKTLLPLSTKKLLILILSSLASYLALLVAQYSFITGLAPFIGIYLLAVSLSRRLHVFTV